MLKKSKGYALILVIVTFALLTILGAVVLSLSLAENKQVAYYAKNMQAYYVAKAGADAMASYIIADTSTVSNLITNTAINPGTGTISGNTFNVKVLNGSSGKIIIKSTGFVGGNQSTINLTLINLAGILQHTTVFSNEAPHMGNNVSIIGDVVTNDTTWNYDPSQITGNVTLGAQLNFPPVSESLFPSVYDPAYAMRDNDKIYAHVANFTDSTIEDIAWDTLHHVTGGTAELHLFVENSIQMNNINPPAGIILYLYYNGTNPLTINNGGFAINHCAIYAPNSVFTKNGGGNGTFLGIMLVNSCTFPNSHGTIQTDPSINTFDIVGTQIYKRDIWSN